METIMIRIFEDFSEYPGLRTINLSDNSGEDFYHKILNEKFYEAVSRNKKLVVDLDSTSGYAPSFLDEAFGNLIYDFSRKVVENSLELISTEEPSWIEMLRDTTFNQWEERRVKNQQPKVFVKHKPWYRFVSGKYEKDVWILPDVLV